MFEINLCCPECGGLEWDVTDDRKRFKCVYCGGVYGFEDMTPQVFEG